MPDENTHDPAAVARAAADFLRRLSTGDLAELRRMDATSAAPAYWRLEARHETMRGRRGLWIEIVRILAILTPKGAPEDRTALHDAARRWGAVLCDGGDPAWPPTHPPRPRFSEQRLVQLMAAQAETRVASMRRAARAVAVSRAAGSGVNTADVAWSLLNPRDGALLAGPYYQRLDRAERETQRETHDA